MSMFLLAASLSSIACGTLPGAKSLVANPSTQWIILGETHGTVEMPDLAADIACHAARAKRQVTVALEQDESNQLAIDTFLSSDGGAAARATFLESPMWNGKFQGGLSSQAMMALIDRLRTMRQAGQVKRVIAIDPHVFVNSAERNKAMAAKLKALRPKDRDLVVVLIGSVHARKGMVGQSPTRYAATAGLLPARQTKSFLILSNGGSAWVCTKVCGATPINQEHDAKRGVTLKKTQDGLYDGLIDLGSSATVSPPAKRPKEN